MKKHKNLLIITIIIFIIAGGIFAADYFNLFHQASAQQKRFMTEIDAANSIVWYYGELDPGKEITINYKKVTEFTNETIGDNENRYAYHAIVIFDLDGEMDISDEQLLCIKEYCENNYYDLLYYGTAHIGQFQKCGFFERLDTTECGFTYSGSYWKNRSGKEKYLNPYLLTGNWSSDDNGRYDTEDEHDMWKFVIQFLIDLVNDSRGELY